MSPAPKADTEGANAMATTIKKIYSMRTLNPIVKLIYKIYKIGRVEAEKKDGMECL
jgi:hypothetical protein